VVSKAIVGNTTYEDIECVGLNPQVDYLEAVVQIKLEGGYSGGICTTGSLEYVRFYADYSNTGAWTDLGVASVRVRDIEGPKPLCYTLRLPIDPPVPFCRDNPLIKVRAILSWNSEPPPATPDFPPVWGAVKDVNVQLRTTRFPIAQIFEAGKLVASATINPFPEASVATSLTLAQKFELYKDKDIQPNRFAFAEVQAATKKSAMFAAQVPGDSVFSALKPAVIADLIKAIQAPSHDSTQYEEVTCVGYRPEDDNVGAVVTVKLPNGYSGSLCDIGSIEYVAFWLDAGSGFNYLGTTGVEVHDLSVIPPGGVQYAVSMPVDVTSWLQACELGAKTATLRAVLSWSTPPSTTDPDDPPYWGNIEECNIQLRPGSADEALIPRILNISGQTADAATIDPISGLTIDGQRPFGGVLAIRAHMGGSPPFHRLYQIQVRRVGALDWTPLANANRLRITEFDISTGNIVDCDPITAVFNVECFPNVPALPYAGFSGVWYEYQNFTSGGRRRYLVESTIGYWHTTPADEGVWDVRVIFRDPGGVTYAPSQSVRVRIDNTAPTVTASLSVAAQQLCGKITHQNGPGGTITGSYDTHDRGTPPNQFDPTYQHFSTISVGVLPSFTDGPTVSLDGMGTTRVLGNTGGSGTWQFITNATTRPCGYAVHFTCVDRTIYGSESGGHWNYSVGYYGTADVGVCVD